MDANMSGAIMVSLLFAAIALAVYVGREGGVGDLDRDLPRRLGGR
ncbi:hypothetical protein [Streptomyces sp. ME19-01-6]|nr:hypothetical protein [Streptomyces sp. ME19-01-6]MDX3225210.1 hypothetical protein [Streptomyces sp. ME19-01-6]